MKRRTWLKVGLGGAVGLAVAGAGVAVLMPRAWDGARLSVGARDMMRALALAVLEDRLPSEPIARRAKLDDFLTRLESALASFPRPTQGEVNQLLTLLLTAPGRWALAGLRTPWAQAGIEDVQAGLNAMRHASLGLRVQAYHALRDLTHGAYYAEASTWADMGYPGPRPLA